MDKQSWMRTAAPAFVSLCLLLGGCSLGGGGAEATLSIEQRLLRYRDRMLEVEPGMSQHAVQSIMGEPDSVITDDKNRLLSRLRASKVLLYHHPTYATVNCVVGIRSNHATRIAMWSASGARAPRVGKCVDVLDFWVDDLGGFPGGCALLEE